MSREEDAYVIERMGKLLAEIAIIVNGAEPHDTLWSYHDLPEKVRALKVAQHPAQPPAGLAVVPEGYALVPAEPTEEMLSAARDWSLKKYGQAVGNDGARGCYAAMLAAAPARQPAAADEVAKHSTQDCYEHFLAYSGLEDSPWIKYAYFHGADVGLDRPSKPAPVALTVLQDLSERFSAMHANGDVWITSVAAAKMAQAAATQAQQPAALVPEGGLRDSVLNSAKFRASCYALVGIVEGIQGLGRCWAANGERLKDTREWVAFYNCVASMRNGTFNQASAEQAQQPAAAVPAEPVAWQYRFATPDGLTWSDWQQISSEAMAREMVEAFGKAGTRAEWRSLKVFDWGGYAGECTDADFADERAQQPAAAVPEPMPPVPDSMGLSREQREVEDAFRRGWNSCRARVMQLNAAALAERNEEQPR